MEFCEKTVKFHTKALLIPMLPENSQDTQSH